MNARLDTAKRRGDFNAPASVRSRAFRRPSIRHAWLVACVTVLAAGGAPIPSSAAAAPAPIAGTATGGESGSAAPSWQTRETPGRVLATALTINSTIRDLTVFCDRGHPLLAMRTKLHPPAGPVTLTFVFRGWTVNVAMTRANRDGSLWLTNLSRSDLPQWLAHRGTNPTTRELARLADRAYLRIDGTTQGEISLKNSSAATQAALGSCYSY